MFSTNTFFPSPVQPDHTKSSTYDSASDAQIRSEPISQSDFVTAVTGFSGLIETAKDAMRTGDFLTLMTKLDELGISADGLKRSIASPSATTPTDPAGTVQPRKLDDK